MKKIGNYLLALLFCISLLLSPQIVNAASDAPIDRVRTELDVPVDGVALKSTATVYEYIDSKNMELITPNTACEVSVVWYKTTAPTTPLSSGYKAKIGENYLASIIIKPKADYTFVEDFDERDNTINGEDVITFPLTAENGDRSWMLKSAEFTTIPAAYGDPVVVIKDMKLSPYEGNPMEVLVEVTNATNVKYQWQIVYDENHMSDEVDLDDNQVYRGTKTPHFKLHTYFGDNFDEKSNYLKVRCEITADNGTVYTPEVWYTLLDRQVVDGITLTGLEKPVFGGIPDYTVASADAEKYSPKYVTWYGPKAEDGTYPRMSGSTKFETGEYQCRIVVATEDAYKIDTAKNAVVDGISYAIDTIEGKNQVPYGPDTYSVLLDFEVSKISLNHLTADITVPKAGELPSRGVSATTGTTATETQWFLQDSKGRYTELEEGETFEPGNRYRCSICLTLEEGYEFASSLTSAINGEEASFSLLKGDDFRWINCIFTIPEETNPNITEAPGVTDTPDVTTVPGTKDDVTVIFDDVYNDWYTPYVQYVFDHSLMTGIKGTNRFEPHANITKAQVAQVLYNMESQPAVDLGSAKAFKELRDVYDYEWYAKAVAWAYETGVVTGDLNAKKFSPGADVTREQLALMIYRYAKEKGYNVSASSDFAGLANADKVADWSMDGMKWAVGAGLISGAEVNGVKDLAPQGNATRAQVAAILQRFCENVVE